MWTTGTMGGIWRSKICTWCTSFKRVRVNPQWYDFQHCKFVEICLATITTAIPHIVGPPVAIRLLNGHLKSASPMSVSQRYQKCTDRVQSIFDGFLWNNDDNVRLHYALRVSTSCLVVREPWSVQAKPAAEGLGATGEVVWNRRGRIRK